MSPHDHDTGTKSSVVSHGTGEWRWLGADRSETRGGQGTKKLGLYGQRVEASALGSRTTHSYLQSMSSAAVTRTLSP